MNYTLRPIGSKFTVVFPATLTGTSLSPYRLTYEVLSHVPGYGGELMNELKCVDVEELPPQTVIPIGVDLLEGRRQYARSLARDGEEVA